MKKSYLLVVFLFFLLGFIKFPVPKVDKVFKPFITPESVEVGSSGEYYVSNIGGFGVNGDGKISKIENDSVSDFVTGLNDPKGLAFMNGNLYAADKNQVWKIDKEGNKSIFADSTDFPVVPVFLNDLVFDKDGNLYVSDTGVFEKEDGVIYMISHDGKVSKVIDCKVAPEIHSPNGLIFDKKGDLLVVDYGTGELSKIAKDRMSAEVLCKGINMGDGLAYDSKGNLYASSWEGGKIYKIDDNFNKVVVSSGFDGPADITIDKEKELLLIPEFNKNQVCAVKL
jgi:gluconolactonase